MAISKLEGPEKFRGPFSDASIMAVAFVDGVVTKIEQDPKDENNTCVTIDGEDISIFKDSSVEKIQAGNSIKGFVLTFCLPDGHYSTLFSNIFHHVD
jgi:hypothetical protein